MKKRILSLALALVMTLSLLPTAVWANQDAVQVMQEETALESGAAAGDAAGTALLRELRLANGQAWETSVQYLDLDANAWEDGKSYSADSIDDVYPTLYAWAAAAEGYSVTVNGVAVNAGSGTQILSSMAGPETQTLTIEVRSGETVAETYTVTLTKQLTLEDVMLTVGGTALVDFDLEEYAYEVTVPAETTEAALEVETPFVDYTVLLNGQPIESSYTLALDPGKGVETFVLEARSADVPEARGHEYTVTVKKTGLIATTFAGLPEGALAAVYDSQSVRIWPDSQNVFLLMEGVSYTYVVTCAGYAGVSGSFTAGAENAVVQAALQKAPDSSHGQGVTSQWPSFRGNEDNNGVISAKTPTLRDNAVLSWAVKLGDGFNSGAVSCPILVEQDGVEYLIVYQGKTIYKVDALTGTVVAAGEMAGTSSFAINSPTFGDGMLFVALQGGQVQAFDAATLESLWLYRDPLAKVTSQPNCPITYDNGYVYTGFWNKETEDGNFVCLSATDEDPTRTDEEKLARWTYTAKGGYYWAGAYVCGDYLLVGADDGNDGYSSQTGKLLCLDPATGERMDEISTLHGDVRSSIAKAGERFYFTSKGGYFYSVSVSRTETGWALTELWELALENNGGGIPMSTSTPVVYNGRAYVGVSGSSQFANYSGHNITVIDLDHREIAYRVETKGYPQTSGLLTTGYMEEDGYVYVYFIENCTPGTVRVLRDRPRQTTADPVDSENGGEAAYALFTPVGAQAQYAICSPIADQYGTLYFKNDSGWLMALSSAVEKVEIAKEPDKTIYGAGEIFDPTGMELRVTYANGVERTLPARRATEGDPIDCAEWSTEPLTREDGTFLISYKLALYFSNEEGGKEEPVIAPALLNLTIRGDVNDDGVTDVYDLQRLYEHCSEIDTLTQQEIRQANMNEGDKVTAVDMQNLYAYLTDGVWDDAK